MISTLLVANRGEIALRVMRSAAARGIRTVAVFSDADRTAPHVRAADVAVRLGPTPASRSYLDVDALLAAARRTGADAVHPGYGFLSERAAFARAVTDAGLTFVGPSAEVIEQMGRKDLARDIAVDAGVPVVPRVEAAAGLEEAPPEAFPVLVKAAAGGGGKGMRVVRDPADLPAAIAAARREAAAAFGDDTLLLERFVERGRHVEVQVLADRHGSVLHLFERDCSAQRRHQKVLEEAPAPRLGAAARALLLQSAVALARRVGYQNAGTVEFLVAGEPGLEEVFFLEMNTRLQVEHPVTEGVVRVAGHPLDLVDLQLAVAAGEPLSFTQEDVTCTGHAIEARVYAEDAFGGFLPQAGRAEVVRWTARARVDAALESGAEVSTAYDPMLGKVVAGGPTREAARHALVAALDDCAVLGLTTNLGFLRALAASDAFRDSQVDTGWLDRHPDGVPLPDPDLPAVVAAWAVARGASVEPVTHLVHQALHTAGAPAGTPAGAPAGAPADPLGVPDGWRLGGPPASTRVELVVAGERRRYAVSDDGVAVAGEPGRTVRAVSVEGPLVRLEVDGVVHAAVVRVGPTDVEVAHRGHTIRFGRPRAVDAAGAAAVSDGTVTAPMPGTVLSVAVSEGQRVDAGQLLGVVEAMKMELALTAPFAGTVASVTAAAGAGVALGAPLFTIEEVT